MPIFLSRQAGVLSDLEPVRCCFLVYTVHEADPFSMVCSFISALSVEALTGRGIIGQVPLYPHFSPGPYSWIGCDYYRVAFRAYKKCEVCLLPCQKQSPAYVVIVRALTGISAFSWPVLISDSLLNPR